MSHNLKENDEDISNLDEVLDDHKDNDDKISKDDDSAATDLEPPEDNEKNGSGQEIIQEESEPGHRDVGGVDVQGDEGEKEREEGKEEESATASSSTPTTTTTTTTTVAATAATTDDTTKTADDSSTPSLVPPSPVSDSKFYAIRTTGGQERVVANVLQNKIKSKNIGIYSILLLENFKGYIIVEAPDANVAFQALAGVRHIRGQIRGELPFKDIEGYLIKKPVVTELAIDDTVEVIGGPFKAMKAKITRVDYDKQEATVVLLDSPYQIPVTVDANYLKKASH
ncbi:MAG TPA: transcription elongation factor Spt5 [Nitrososphaeraceae archaeon]|nr:transcription elongation factor Spt5 [Nitrososphaeraceae archaeon]